MEDLSNFRLGVDSGLPGPDAENVVLPTTTTSLHVEVPGIHISLPKFSHPGALTGNGALQGGQAEALVFHLLSQILFDLRQLAMVLLLVQPHDDLTRHQELRLDVANPLGRLALKLLGCIPE